MELHIYDNEQQIGPFAPEVVQQMLESGALSPNAQVWHEGAPDWIPILTFFPQQAPPAAAPPSRFQPAAVEPMSRGPDEGAVFVKAAVAGLGVALIAGVGWAALQAFASPLLQLPYAIGVAFTFLCCHTVNKASFESSGGFISC